jgi:hypothetical protein
MNIGAILHFHSNSTRATSSCQSYTTSGKEMAQCFLNSSFTVSTCLSNAHTFPSRPFVYPKLSGPEEFSGECNVMLFNIWNVILSFTYISILLYIAMFVQNKRVTWYCDQPPITAKKGYIHSRMIFLIGHSRQEQHASMYVHHKVRTDPCSAVQNHCRYI